MSTTDRTSVAIRLTLLEVSLGVWWYVWGVKGFWWGVVYGLGWETWVGYRLAQYLLGGSQ